MDNLPEHLLATIAEFLNTRIETLCFRAVCNSFRSSVPPPLPPLSHFKIPFPPGMTDDGYLELTESTVYAIQPLDKSTETWLVKVEESNSGKIQVMDPLFKLRIKNSSEMLPESFNLLDYRVKEIAKSFRLEMVSNSHPFYVEKAVVSSDDDNAGEFVLMALISEGRVGVWGSKDERWAIIDFGYESFYCKDIIYHKKKLYAMGFDGFTVAVDPKSLNVTEAATAPGKSQSHLMMHSLVKSRDDLFLINTYWIYKYYQHGPLLGRIRLDVFKLDEEKCEWIEEDGLKDQVLFLGEDGSFMLSAKEFPACKGNSGYLMYMDLCGVDFDFYPPTEDVAYFDLEDSSPGSQPGALSKYWEDFWPLPTWFRQKTNLKLSMVEKITHADA
ncbi:F-box protein SKIP23-like [Pistacia vera]|uniref:F-box protein SKIP23-like n=1 Tax=Pistacia vera TaxID=55513 RepID=UPI001262D8BF|nr:F-box protein SKIP23-like [Pistacia vera]